MNGDRAWAQVQAWGRPALSQVLSPDIAQPLAHRPSTGLESTEPFFPYAVVSLHSIQAENIQPALQFNRVLFMVNTACNLWR